MSLWGAVMGHANLILHGAGWMEGGLVASFEKMVVDAEMHPGDDRVHAAAGSERRHARASMPSRKSGRADISSARRHTLERYETAFYAPLCRDWRNFETWRLAGAVDAAQHANAIWKQLLADTCRRRSIPRSTKR